MLLEAGLPFPRPGLASVSGMVWDQLSGRLLVLMVGLGLPVGWER